MRVKINIMRHKSKHSKKYKLASVTCGYVTLPYVTLSHIRRALLLPLCCWQSWSDVGDSMSEMRYNL